MEEVHKKRKADRAADLENRLQALDPKNYGNKNTRDASPPNSIEPPGMAPGTLGDSDPMGLPHLVHRPGVAMIPGKQRPQKPIKFKLKCY